MSLQQKLLLLLLLGQPGFCLMIQNENTKCSSGQLELLSKQQYFASGDSVGGYQMIVEENLKFSSDVTSKDSDEDQMVEYQGILKYVYYIV